MPGADALPSDVRTVRAQVNALCARAAYTQGHLGQAETRARRTLSDEPDKALAQDIQRRIADRLPLVSYHRLHHHPDQQVRWAQRRGKYVEEIHTLRAEGRTGTRGSWPLLWRPITASMIIIIYHMNKY